MTRTNDDDRSAILEAFWDALEKSPFVMIGAGPEAHHVPMTAQFDAHRGPIWFYSGRSNRLAQDLGAGRDTMAQFVGKGHDIFACLAGRLSEETDPAMIDRFWSDMVAAWFEQGRDDPELMMLRLDIRHAEIWQPDISIMGQLKMVFGGDVTPEDVEGKHLQTAL